MTMLAFVVQTKARRNILLEHFQAQHAMAGFDELGVIVVAVVMTVAVRAPMRRSCTRLLQSATQLENNRVDWYRPSVGKPWGHH